MPGSQDFTPDPRNADLLIYVNGALVPRAEAKVSIFDAARPHYEALARYKLTAQA